MLFFSLMMLFSKYAFVCFCICLLIFCVLFLFILLLFLDLCLFVVFLSTNYSYCSYLYLFHGGQPVYPLCLSPLALILVLASYSSVCPRESGVCFNRSIPYVLMLRLVSITTDTACRRLWVSNHWHSRSQFCTYYNLYLIRIKTKNGFIEWIYNIHVSFYVYYSQKARLAFSQQWTLPVVAAVPWTPTASSRDSTPGLPVRRPPTSHFRKPTTICC